MERNIDEINEKIRRQKAVVLTVEEAKSLIKEKGIKHFFNNIDIVTCASFEMNTNAILYLSFGQTDPLIYFSEGYLNDVPIYVTGSTDLVISMVAFSKENPEYSGASVLCDILNGKDVHLKVSGRSLEVFPNKDFDTWINIKNLNSGRLLLNQSINQNGIVATNSGNKDINSHMGTLIGNIENSTYNSTSYLNPLVNDPFCKTIGVGTYVWLSGSRGIVLGHGSNHNPKQKRNDHGIPVGPAITLSIIADIESMQPKWVRAGFIKSFGPVLYIGVGIPIPVLNEEIAEYLAITDEYIHSTIVDFAIPRRTKPIFGQCTYAELRTSTVEINNKPTLAAPLASMSWTIEICKILKDKILNNKFLLSMPILPVNMESETKKLNSRLAEMA